MEPNLIKESSTKKKYNKTSSLSTSSQIALIIFVGLSLFIIIATIILIALTKPEKEVEVPDVVGKQFIEIYNSLVRKGLKPEIKFYDTPDIDNGTILDQHPESGNIIYVGSKLKLILSRSNILITVPNLIGSKISFALNKLKNLHVNNKSFSLDPGVISYIPSNKKPSNIVIDQNPMAGEGITPNRKINLLISAGKINMDMVMPQVVGQSINLCFDLLLAKGLNIFEDIVETNIKRNNGMVFSQEPHRGTKISKGSNVKLKVYYYHFEKPPPISYERIDYTISTDDKKGLYEVFIEDSKSKRIRFFRVIKSEEKISFLFHRIGKAKISILCNKKIIDTIGIDPGNYD